jgi:hypothetical protein
MQPFNLDRFKAGEPAYDKDDNTEYFYISELRDGRNVVKFEIASEWIATFCSHEFLNEWFYMKEKELTWDDVHHVAES